MHGHQRRRDTSFRQSRGQIARERFGRLGADCDKAAVKLGDLLFVHELSAGGDNIVLGFKRVDSTLRGEIPAALLPLIQARLLARHLRGDVQHYEPWVSS